MINAGQVLNDRYQIIKMIGKGGMSTVYQAKDLGDGRLLAVKDVRRSGKDENTAVEQSLVTEGRMLKQLSNPHLPRIYDIIENPDSFMLVMDFIEGESLDRVIAREGAQPMDRVLDWGMQICEVFEYLHSQPTPIIYRDMKPANVILQPDGQLKMIDFGTARTQKLGVAMAADTLCLGTAGFAAPEQFGGFGQSTPRTDIFCLGATLYNMITGHSPCDRPQGILPLERWDPALKDTPVSSIISRCTRNDPDERYQTVRELYEALNSAKNGTFGAQGSRSGKLARDFQRLNVKSAGGYTGGLSGLLSFGKPATEKVVRKDTGVHGSQWQTPQAAPIPELSTASDAVPPQPREQVTDVWGRLTLISLIIASVMVVFGILLMALGQITGGLVFVIVALGAAVLAAAGVILSKTQEGA